MEGFLTIGIILVLISDLVRCIIKTPEQIHLSLGTSHDTMVVMWASDDTSLHSYVRYGLDSDQLGQMANATRAEMPSNSRKAVRYVYRAEMKGLAENSSYFYEITMYNPATNELQRSERFQFRTFSDEESSHMFLVYGDFGSDSKLPTYDAIMKEVTSHNYTAILHNGDFAYDLFEQEGKVGDEFMRNIQPFAARIPYMTSVGNHEIQHDDPFIQYRVRFSMPGTPWPMPANKLWWSYDIGLVHFIIYSSEVFFTDNYDIECQQFHWLKADLISANRNRDRRPWIIAMAHRPMYCSVVGFDCWPEVAPALRNGLEALFYAQGVDLVLEAHEHLYRRLWPLYDGQVTARDYVQPRAPVHIISGAAGNYEGIDRKTGNWDNEWSAFVADTDDHSYGILTVLNSTHIQFQQKSSETMAVMDDVYIIQNQHGPFIDNVNCSGSDVHRSCDCPAHTPVPVTWTLWSTDILTSLSLFVVLGAIIIYFKCIRKRTHIHRSRYSDVEYEPVDVTSEE